MTNIKRTIISPFLVFTGNCYSTRYVPVLGDSWALVMLVFFLLVPPPRFALITFSINTLQLLLSFGFVLLSSRTLSMPLFAQFSRCNLDLPHLLSSIVGNLLLSKLVFSPPIFGHLFLINTSVCIQIVNVEINTHSFIHSFDQVI